MKKKSDIKESFIGIVFLAGRSISERGRWKLRLLSWLVPVAALLITLHANCKMGL